MICTKPGCGWMIDMRTNVTVFIGEVELQNPAHPCLNPNCERLHWSSGYAVKPRCFLKDGKVVLEQTQDRQKGRLQRAVG